MNAKDEIKRLLTKHPHLQDSDQKLIATFWFNEIKAKGINIYEITGHEFLKLFAENKLHNTGGLRRMRRKVQEENKHLRGKYYHDRQTTKQKEWKERLGYEVNK
jgi:hypothetical protein